MMICVAFDSCVLCDFWLQHFNVCGIRDK